MRSIINKLFFCLHRIGQPLIKRSEASAALSDLFIWRSDNGWITSFFTIPFNNLFNPDDVSISSELLLVFFDANGTELARDVIVANSVCALNIEVSKRVGAGGFGLFACFNRSQLAPFKSLRVSDRGMSA